jgi:hypothetical protein
VTEGVTDAPGGPLGLGVGVDDGVIDGVFDIEGVTLGVFETLGVFDIVGVTLGVLLGD